jgi:hypothetical protein
MKKAWMLTALVVSTGLVPNNEDFEEYSCGGQEVTSVIVCALGWKLWDELLALEIGRLTSGSSETTCTSSGGPFLSVLTDLVK